MYLAVVSSWYLYCLARQMCSSGDDVVPSVLGSMATSSKPFLFPQCFLGLFLLHISSPKGSPLWRIVRYVTCHASFCIGLCLFGLQSGRMLWWIETGTRSVDLPFNTHSSYNQLPCGALAESNSAYSTAVLLAGFVDFIIFRIGFSDRIVAGMFFCLLCYHLTIRFQCSLLLTLTPEVRNTGDI